MSGIDPRIAEAVARLPDYLGGHVLVSAAAIFAAGVLYFRQTERVFADVA